MSRLPGVIAISALIAFTTPAFAQNVKVPYWASVRAEVVNMRVGPSTSYRIEWVYKRVFLPVKIIRREEGWRLVEDPDGTKGWMLGRMLSRARSAIVIGEGQADMRKEANVKSALLWRLEPGVVIRLHDCKSGWCNVELKNYKGFVRRDRLWGPGEP
ncbi:MAG: SH3 domain-containing protein [Novosphingobium sp.]|nr:SH3 domain-containing protein [Novosphingobium sp.]